MIFAFRACGISGLITGCERDVALRDRFGGLFIYQDFFVLESVGSIMVRFQGTYLFWKG